MLHRPIVWPAAFSFTSNINRGVDANQPNLSTTLLTIVIILLALGFLLSGIAIFYRLSQPGQVARTRQMVNVSRRGGTMAAILVLVIPIIVLFAGTSLLPPTPPPTPTPIVSSVTPSASTTPLPLVNPSNLTFTVGVSDINYTSPPEIYYDNNKSPAGFDIELIKAIAHAMNLKPPNIVPTKVGSPDQLLEGLKNKNFDVVISAYVLTDIINSETLSVHYLKPQDILLVPNGNPGKLNFNALPDLCGHTIGVQDNTLELDTLNKTNQNCPQDQGSITIEKFANANDLVNALINKQRHIEAIYQSTPTVSYYHHQFQGKFQQVGNPVPLSDEGILIRHDNQPMQTAIQTAFNLLVNDGTYQTLLNTPMGDLRGDALTASVTPAPTVAPSQ